jgi:hypothetical protein
MWFIVSLVIAVPPAGLRHGKSVVQRKPALNHSVVNPSRNWPGAPLCACCM